ncbi:hypothetical protein [Gilvimarinus algae]|uniref:Solute-binding protein family 3/N-terminal domain-containing protein n=1 Tax=Gilvimarinus algae TaxID=3058037 RepID=A0ABT8TIR8_9GAMM|nr:hypothetical protein [Gilvimarinus sp. SDUM040014]MDO3383379.1 hypothetical protein [Gilvimarinus sp. SDUM040014]
MSSTTAFVYRVFCGLLIVLTLAFSPLGQAQTVPIRVTVTPDILADYRRFVAGRAIGQIHHYDGKGARRDVIELVLLQQALLLGGFDQRLDIVPEQTYRRTLHQVASGELIGSGALVWRSDITPLDGELYTSSAVVRHGEFTVGLYTAAHNRRAINADADSLRQLRVVTSPDWKTDIATLRSLGFERLYFTNSWVSMVRMLAAERADITLAPFQRERDMSIDTPEGQLLPLPGFKVALDGTRHWIVSRRHPLGSAYYSALEKGLALLRSKGTIVRAYQECGFYNDQVSNWQRLGPKVGSKPAAP